jgi:hypothetical protein
VQLAKARPSAGVREGAKFDGAKLRRGVVSNVEGGGDVSPRRQ